MLLKLTNEYAATYGASTSSMEIVTYIENLPLNSSVRGSPDEIIKKNGERISMTIKGPSFYIATRECSIR